MFPLCSAGQSSSAGPVNDPAVAVGWAEPGHPAAASPATPQTTGIQQIQLSRAAHQLSHHQTPAAELLGPAGPAADVPQQLVQGAGGRVLHGWPVSPVSPLHGAVCSTFPGWLTVTLLGD